MSQRDVVFDAAAYSIDAIQRAIYKLSDRMSADIAVQDGAYRCAIYFAVDEEDAAESILAEFRNEVLDQTLRERIRNETAEARNLILAIAFSNTGLAGPADS